MWWHYELGGLTFYEFRIGDKDLIYLGDEPPIKYLFTLLNAF